MSNVALLSQDARSFPSHQSTGCQVENFTPVQFCLPHGLQAFALGGKCLSARSYKYGSRQTFWTNAHPASAWLQHILVLKVSDHNMLVMFLQLIHMATACYGFKMVYTKKSWCNIRTPVRMTILVPHSHLG